MAETVTLTELPENPKGWTKRMAMHINFGSDGGSMAYTIHDERGREVTGLAMGYDTRIKDTEARREGFYIVGVTGYLSWKEVREKWNARHAHPEQSTEDRK